VLSITAHGNGNGTDRLNLARKRRSDFIPRESRAEIYLDRETRREFEFAFSGARLSERAFVRCPSSFVVPLESEPKPNVTKRHAREFFLCSEERTEQWPNFIYRFFHREEERIDASIIQSSRGYPSTVLQDDLDKSTDVGFDLEENSRFRRPALTIFRNFAESFVNETLSRDTIISLKY
jgi:hypothetical protein